jgi:uncharacterized protein YjdB
MTANQNYEFVVKAVDYSGNLSGPSNSISLSSPPEVPEQRHKFLKLEIQSVLSGNTFALALAQWNCYRRTQFWQEGQNISGTVPWTQILDCSKYGGSIPEFEPYAIVFKTSGNLDQAPKSFRCYGADFANGPWTELVVNKVSTSGSTSSQNLTAADYGNTAGGYTEFSFERYIPPTVNIESVTVNPASLLLNPGNQYTLTKVVLPTNASDKNVNWTSSNSSVATVDGTGKVTAVAVGNATITATSLLDASKKGTCSVAVTNNPVEVTGITLNSGSVTLNKFETSQLTETVLPINAANKAVSWTSDNTAVATVSSSGLITANGEGNATITATTVSAGKTAICNVTVNLPLFQYVKLVSKATIGGGNTTEMNDIVWKNISDVTVATNWKQTTTLPGEFETNLGSPMSMKSVTLHPCWTKNYLPSSFDVYGKKNIGDSYILIYSISSLTLADYATTPKEFLFAGGGGTVSVTGVSLNKTTTSITLGSNETLIATVAPANATNKNVSWSSSNTAVATVNSSGAVTGVAAGTATITVTTQDGGKTATCTVTVSVGGEVSYRYYRFTYVSGSNGEIAELDNLVGSNAYPATHLNWDTRALATPVNKNAYACFDNELNWGPNLVPGDEIVVDLSTAIAANGIKITLPHWGNVTAFKVDGGNSMTGPWTNQLTLSGINQTGGAITYPFTLKSATGITGISNHSSDEVSVLVYPNPTSSELNIKVSGAKGMAEVLVTDLSGKQLYCDNYNVSDKITIETSGLSGGVYILRISGSNIFHRSTFTITR